MAAFSDALDAALASAVDPFVILRSSGSPAFFLPACVVCDAEFPCDPVPSLDHAMAVGALHVAVAHREVWEAWEAGADWRARAGCRPAVVSGSSLRSLGGR